jgi:DNA-binding response OmpR family regulator
MRSELQIVDDRMEVVIDDACIRLKPTSFKLFCSLAEHPGRWVRATALRGRVLGTHFLPGASNLRWHVHELRAALGSFSAFLHSDQSLGLMFLVGRCTRPHCLRGAGPPSAYLTHT